MASPQQAASSPRRNRGISFRSERSNHSSGSGAASANKVHLTESHEEKIKRNLHTKADPTVAMSEAQPMAVALEKSNLGSLRGVQYKDQFGNVITDPDRSNPTRPRLERPLDTIRSFEAAIYGTYASRPTSYVKPDNATTPGDFSRRSSYFGAPNGTNGYSSRGQYDNGRYASRPNSYIDNSGQADNFYPYNNQGGGRPRRRSPRMNPERMNSEQAMYNNNQAQNAYAQNAYAHNGPQKPFNHQATASGSSTEQWNNSTNPSSVNSSIDQFQQQQQQQQQQFQQQQQQKIADSYGFQGFGPGPNLAQQQQQQPVIKHSFGQAPPASDPNNGGPVGGGPPPSAAGALANNRRSLRKSTAASVTSEKRQSWFKRKFSKG